MGTNQVRDAESILTGPIYAIAEPSSFGDRAPRVRVTVQGGSGMQDVNVTPDLAETLRVGQTVAWWVRFGLFTPDASDRNPNPRAMLVCVFIRPVAESDLDALAGALPSVVGSK